MLAVTVAGAAVLLLLGFPSRGHHPGPTTEIALILHALLAASLTSSRRGGLSGPVGLAVLL